MRRLLDHPCWFRLQRLLLVRALVGSPPNTAEGIASQRLDQPRPGPRFGGCRRASDSSQKRRKRGLRTPLPALPEQFLENDGPVLPRNRNNLPLAPKSRC